MLWHHNDITTLWQHDNVVTLAQRCHNVVSIVAISQCCNTATMLSECCDIVTMLSQCCNIVTAMPQHCDIVATLPQHYNEVTTIAPMQRAKTWNWTPSWVNCVPWRPSLSVRSTRRATRGPTTAALPAPWPSRWTWAPARRRRWQCRPRQPPPHLRSALADRASVPLATVAPVPPVGEGPSWTWGPSRWVRLGWLSVNSSILKQDFSAMHNNWTIGMWKICSPVTLFYRL